MRWPALILTALMLGSVAAAVAYVVAGDLVREFLDEADPVAAFADELQAEVDAALIAADIRWQDRPHFARWEQEFS